MTNSDFVTKRLTWKIILVTVKADTNTHRSKENADEIDGAQTATLMKTINTKFTAHICKNR